MSRSLQLPFVFVGVALLFGLALALRAQQEKQGEDAEQTREDQRPKVTLLVGDPAPPLKVEKFLKGEPIREFKPGHVYVVEFWATWCGPCIRGMPHLTELQKKFKDKVTIIGVNIWESPYDDETLERVAEFVKKNDEKMGYTVAYDGADGHADRAYMKAAGQNGIPTAFVVSGDGKIAHIGHPMAPDFEKALEQLVDGKFDMAAAVEAYKKRRAEEEKLERQMAQIEKLSAAADELLADGKLEEALAKYDEITKLVPEFAPQVELRKFMALMDRDKYDRAYEIAEKLIAGPMKDDPFQLNNIAWRIVDPEAKVARRNVDLALKAAELSVKLTEEKEPAILDTLARCYWLKGDKAKAIALQTKAVALAKAKEKKELEGLLEPLERTLDEYKKDTK